MPQIQCHVHAIIPLSDSTLANASRLAELRPDIEAFAAKLGPSAIVSTVVVKSKRELPEVPEAAAQARREEPKQLDIEDAIERVRATGGHGPVEAVAPKPKTELRAALRLAGDTGASRDELFSDCAIPAVELLKAERSGEVVCRDGRYYLAETLAQAS